MVLRPLGCAVDFLRGRTVSRAPPHSRAGPSAARQGSVAVVAVCQEQVEEDPEIRSAWKSQRIQRMSLAELDHVDLDM